MNVPAADPWLDANQRHLSTALSRLRDLLAHRLDGNHAAPAPPLVPDLDLPPGTAMHRLAGLFQLSTFEQAVLLLCAGVELDSRIAGLCAALQHDPARIHPTPGLALSLLPGAHWSALLPTAPLRYWRLVTLADRDSFTQGALRIDERILHYLAGLSYLDARLDGCIEPVSGPADLAPSHQLLAREMASAWMQDGHTLPVIQLIGSASETVRGIALSASHAAGWELCMLRAGAIPSAPGEMSALLRVWERETLLSLQALLLLCDDVETVPSALRWIERLHYPLIIASPERLPVRQHSVLTFEVGKPSAQEQNDLWRAALGPLGAQLNGQVSALVSQFRLDAVSIQSIAAGALRSAPASTAELSERLWQACRSHAAPRLGELAQRLAPSAGWDDLVLPDAQKQALQEIAVHVRQRLQVYETWGFAARGGRGLGISALFAGASGTGKTMAAEVLSQTLDLDLYRIDLSQVVNKYIGETEKNLRRVFNAAEESGAILFFDEADALFGKRTEVKDSHDRYANIEVNYLLQRMESYRGLAILATNLKEALDPAFLRRLRFVVHFPIPDEPQRSEIWRRVYPPQTPRRGLDYDKLARLNVTGGSIRNIALHSAFLAADAGQPVHMEHILRAVRVEFAKLERPVSEAEVKDWV